MNIRNTIKTTHCITALTDLMIYAYSAYIFRSYKIISIVYIMFAILSLFLIEFALNNTSQKQFTYIHLISYEIYLMTLYVLFGLKNTIIAGLFYSITDIYCQSYFLSKFTNKKINTTIYSALGFVFILLSIVIQKESTIFPIYKDIPNTEILSLSIITISAALTLINHKILSEFAIDNEHVLKNKFNTDHLTNLPNRNALETYWNRYVGTTTMCVAILDIDHFKKFNDAFSHNFGDEVLKRVSNVAYNQVEKYTHADGIVGRWGGEEFIIIFPFRNNYKHPQDILELVRKAIENTILKAPNAKHVRVTVSIGGIITDNDDYSTMLNSLVELADKNLYEAKNNGRNQVRLTQEQ